MGLYQESKIRDANKRGGDAGTVIKLSSFDDLFNWHCFIRILATNNDNNILLYSTSWDSSCKAKREGEGG